MKDINKENYLQKLFIDEAKASFSRFPSDNSEELIAEVTEQISAVNEQIAGLDQRVKALEPGTNMFNFSVFAEEFDESDVNHEDASVVLYNYTSYISARTLREYCPDLKIGETYIFSFEFSQMWGSGGGWGSLYDRASKSEIYDRTPFVLTESLYDSYITLYVGEDYMDDGTGNMMPYPGAGTFYHIQLNKGTEVLPFEPYKG